MLTHAKTMKGTRSLSHKVRGHVKQRTYGTFSPKTPQLSPEVTVPLRDTPYRAVCNRDQHYGSSTEAELEMHMIHNPDNI